MLVQYPWPGNVRELRNVIERAMILSETGELGPEDLPPEIASHTVTFPHEISRFQFPPAGVSLEDVERDFVRQALELTHGNQTQAARLLGLTRDELRDRAKKFDLGNRTDDVGA